MEVGQVTALDDGVTSAFRAAGDELAGRVEAMRVDETLAGGKTMLRGQRVLSEYVKGSIAGTPSASEPIAELQSEDFGVGNAAIHVCATDSAIAMLGTAGLSAVVAIDGERLSDAVKRASRHVRARLDVDDGGRLIQVLKVK